MDHSTNGSAARFETYIGALTKVLGHATRVKPARDYCIGLLMPGERKSVEPMAALTAPERTAAQHQSLMHFVSQGDWSDQQVLAQVQAMVVPRIEQQGAIEAWIIDDTGIPKQGKHSVGVARQYCGQLGKQDNCQVAVSLSIANHHASLPVAYRMYLPKEWAGDRARRKQARVPKDIRFKTKPEIALEQLRAACAAGLPRGTVLMDAGYGVNTALREGVAALGLSYVAGTTPQATVWTKAKMPLRPKSRPGGRGRQPTRLRRDAKHQPTTIETLALGLPAKAWRTIRWREGSAEWLSSRFARVRIRVAHQDYKLTEPRPEEWLLIEWPKGDDKPAKYWFSNHSENISFEQLVDLTKLRWRIERDYQELKQEVGLGHFEGRSWRGFHHHATLCIAAYGFLVSEREAIPPSAPRCSALFQAPEIPEGHKPRSATTAHRATRSELHRHRAITLHPRDRPTTTPLSLLRKQALHTA